MGINGRIVQITDRFIAGGRAAISDRENVARDISDLYYLVVEGTVGGLLDHTDSSRRAELITSVDAVEMPELSLVVREIFSSSSAPRLKELQAELYRLENETFVRLNSYLDGDESAPSG